MSPLSDDTQRLISYLAAKKAVDDRSLSQHVWQTTWGALPEGRVRVLEIGCGIGTMLERILESGVVKHGQYLGLDLQAELLGEAQRRLLNWANDHSMVISSDGDGYLLSQADFELSVSWQTADATDLSAGEISTVHDLLIASAFLDLVDLETTIPSLLEHVRPGGLFYFPITFDGLTCLLPQRDATLEAEIERLYHRTMDSRRVAGKPSGSSRAGRDLLAYLVSSGHEILAAGPSDWLIMSEHGSYSEETRFFLSYILDTIAGALSGEATLPESTVRAWLNEKRELLAQGKLIYLTHQIDVCGRKH